MKREPLDLYGGDFPPGIHLIEASAGTGKTYAISQLVVRFVVEDDMPLPEILVVTFTRAATAELKMRIRARLVEVRDGLQGRPCDDPALAQWLEGLEDTRQALSRVQAALLQLDEAMIFTIDGFIAWLVRRFGVTLGLGPTVHHVADETALMRQAMDAVWTEWMAREDVPARRLWQWCEARRSGLSGRRGTQPLVDGLLNLFRRWTDAPRFVPDRRDADVAALGQRWRDALAQCHAFRQRCQEDAALAQSVMEAAQQCLVKRGGEAVAEWLAADETAMPDATLLQLMNHRRKRASRCDLTPLMPLVDALTALSEVEAQLDQAIVQHLWQQWRQTCEQRLTMAQQTTHGRLKRQVAEALAQSETVRREVGALFRVGLIDEFQDTDRVQWQLFRDLFADPQQRLFLIGDPKQGIYQFRGADLETYFAAAGQARYHHDLTHNWRSHPAVIAGINDLFAERPDAFDDPERLQACVVKPGRPEGHVALADSRSDRGRWRSGFSLVTLAPVAEQSVWTSKAAIETALLTQLQQDVCDLLTHGQWCTPEGERRPLAPHDIAVLVQTNERAQAVQAALRQVGVPGLFEARATVVRSDAAASLMHILQALLHPGDRTRVLTALAQPPFGLDADALAILQTDADALAQWQCCFIQWGQQWRQQGIGAALHALLHECRGWVHLAHRPDGDRWTADMRHLIEWLQARQHAQRLGPQSLMRWFVRQYHTAGEEGDELTRLRLERDEAAVQIITVHRAKGLEYPVVIAFDLWDGQESTRRTAPLPVALNTAAGQTVYFAPDDAIRDMARQRQRQEKLRLAYVALTRARTHCRIYRADYGTRAKQPTLHWSPLRHLIDAARLETLAARPHWQVETVCAETLTSPMPWKGRSVSTALRPPPKVDWAARFARARRMFSYTALVRRYHQHGSGAVVSERLQEALPGLVAVSDEADREEALPPGVVTGQLLHTLLETADFARLARGELDEPQLKQVAVQHGLSMDRIRETVGSLLEAVARTPLWMDAPPLAQWPSAALQRELAFMLPVTVGQLDALNRLLENEPGFAPLHSLETLRGYLHGFIDLVAWEPEQKRVHVADYKSNRLPAYDADALAQAMAQHHYLWQALIYALAVRRMIRRFAPDYRLGEVSYVFLRGMPQGEGLFRWRPDEALLEAVEHCLGGEVSA